MATATAVAVSEGQIVAAGSDDEVKKLARDINERFRGYVFEIPEEPGKKLTCEHVNLLEGAGIKACA